MKKEFHWKQIEIEVLKEKYFLQGYKIPELLKNHTSQAISMKARRLGLSSSSDGRFKKGQVPWINGKHHTKESIETQRNKLKEWYKDPKNAETIKEMQTKQNNGRKRHINKLKKEGKYEEYKKNYGKKVSKTKKGVKFTEDHKKALSDNHWAKNPKHRHIIEKTGRKLKKAHASGKLKNWNEGLTKETDERLARSKASQPHSDEWNRRVGEANKKSDKFQNWVKSDRAKECRRKAGMVGWTKRDIRPTKPELRFEEIIKKYTLPYKYVGDGQFWMGHPPRNPDFINVNGEKKVVEIHGVYWHLIRPQKEQPNLTREIVEIDEKRHYSQYGFDCIILWEDELKDDQHVLDQIGITTLI